jgi:RNA polymerase sigma-70 factor (sigma-E family)
VTQSGELTGFCKAAWPRLVGALSLYTGDRDVAEELAQEALVRVCERWDEVETMESPLGWAHRVAFNLANSHYRRFGAERRARRRLQAIVDLPRPEFDAADGLALRAAVASLAEEQRSVLVLRYYADLPIAEVARVLEMPEGTVKTHARRGIARLREQGLIDNDSHKEADGVG